MVRLLNIRVMVLFLLYFVIKMDLWLIFQNYPYAEVLQRVMGTDTIRDLRGRLYLIYGYSNGKRHGTYIKYHTNGRIASFSVYQNGNSRFDSLPTFRGFNTGSGTDTIRDLNGTIYRTYNYQNGVLHGAYTEYRTDGSISLIRNYQNGQLTWNRY